MEIKTEVRHYCDGCGAVLEVDDGGGFEAGVVAFQVKPCKKCQEGLYDEGHSTALSDAVKAVRNLRKVVSNE